MSYPRFPCQMSVSEIIQMGDNCAILKGGRGEKPLCFRWCPRQCQWSWLLFSAVVEALVVQPVSVGLWATAPGQQLLPDLWATPSPSLCFSIFSKITVTDCLTNTGFWYWELSKDTGSRRYESRVAYLNWPPCPQKWATVSLKCQ